MNQIVNNIQLARNLKCILRIYNPMVRFKKKYIIMLILLVRIVANYNQVCSQMLSFVKIIKNLAREIQQNTKLAQNQLVPLYQPIELYQVFNKEKIF